MRHHTKLLVIADDLTGALDVGAEFGKRNAAVRVELSRRLNWTDLWLNCDVIAVDTESRHEHPDEAARRVGSIVREGIKAGATHFFKKTDSTLRGNVGRELSVLAHEFGRPVFYVAAAPLYGRVTRQGFQFVGEMLLHETAFAHDPLEPITTSHVPTLLEKQSTVPVRWVTLAELSRTDRARPEGPSIWVIDAENEEDVRAIARQLRDSQGLRVLAGTARFAAHLADVLEVPSRSGPPIQPTGPMLVVNGSLNERAFEQVRWAMNESLFTVIRMPPDLLFGNEAARMMARGRLLEELANCAGRDVLLYSVTHRNELNAYTEAAGHDHQRADQVYLTAASRMGEWVSRVLRGNVFKFVVVFGGDTLCALAKSMEWPALYPRTEIVPGVAVSTVSEDRTFLVATKPGGFGPVNVLEAIHHFVSRTSDGTGGGSPQPT